MLPPAVSGFALLPAVEPDHPGVVVAAPGGLIPAGSPKILPHVGDGAAPARGPRPVKKILFTSWHVGC